MAEYTSDEFDFIDIDDDFDDDSAYGDGADSIATSLRSSITRHVYENGRRYHSFRAGTYWGPNDDEAQDNLDLFHHVFSLSMNGNLYLAPIGPNPQRVLDIGTGTGIWALDFADTHPNSIVIATDLSPVQPGAVPPNLEFQIDDFTLEWTFAPNSFDFIHARSIYGCVADYPQLYSEVLQALKPGAYFEQAEISVLARSEDGTTEGGYIELWGKLAIDAGKTFGKSFSIAEDCKGLMEQAGFVNVTQKVYKWPVGTWPRDKKLKEIGAYNRLGWEEGIEGWAMYLFTNYMKWRIEEIQVLIAKIRNELRNGSIHAIQDMRVVYGQKPFENTT